MGANMQKLMKQAQKMQRDMERLQQEAAQMIAEATVGGGAVTVVADGSQTIRSVKIEPEAIDLDDIEMLQDMVQAACNEALSKAQDQLSAEMQKITGGMNMPGMF